MTEEYYSADGDCEDRVPSNPLTIITGTPDENTQFEAFPHDGTICISQTGLENGYTEFTVEEFGLIAALLIGTADGDY
jgi:hypothetical protein